MPDRPGTKGCRIGGIEADVLSGWWYSSTNVTRLHACESGGASESLTRSWSYWFRAKPHRAASAARPLAVVAHCAQLPGCRLVWAVA